MQASTFPVCPARLVHVYMCVNQAWCHNQVPIVKDVLQAKGKQGCVCQIRL